MKITTNNPPASHDVAEDKRASYTITFTADGKFSAQADCNPVTGTYTDAQPGDSGG